MDLADLERVDAALRHMCGNGGLRWVLDSVDAAIREGVSESVDPGSSAYHERGGNGWLGTYDSASGKRPQPEIREREYTAHDRVVLLLDAMLGVYQGLPEIRRATFDTLNQGWHGRVPPVESITFVEDGADGDFVMAEERPEDAEPRQRVVRALLDLRAEVLS